MNNDASNYQMTPTQLKQWKDYGCVSRCLIKLAAMDGKTLSDEQFCEKFEHLFPRPDDRFGILDERAFNEIVSTLGLASTVETESDYMKTKEKFTQGKRVLMMSKVNLNPGATDEINHCSVLTKIDDSGFSIWTPLQSGGVWTPDFANEEWQGKQCSALVFS